MYYFYREDFTVSFVYDPSSDQITARGGSAATKRRPISALPVIQHMMKLVEAMNTYNVALFMITQKGYNEFNQLL